jgi:hypothetical protein
MFAPLLAFDDDSSAWGESEPDIDATTDLERGQALRSEAIGEQALPNEMIGLILEHLIADEAMHTVAKLANVNKAMYGWIVPTLYETIRVTETNRDSLLIGCTGTSASTIARLMDRSPRRIESGKDSQGYCDD